MKNHQKGMLYLVLATFLFTLTNVLIRLCTARYPLNQIIFGRFFFALIPLGLMIFWKKEPFSYRHLWPQAGRCAFSLCGLACMFYSFGHMPILADAIAISFGAVLFSIFVAIPILKEWPSQRHVIACFIGFFGILCIAKPSGEILHFAALMGIVGAFLDAIAVITGRLLTERGLAPLEVTFHYTAIASLLSGATLFFSYEALDGFGFLLFLGMGCFGGIGMYYLVKGFSLAPASIAAPMMYTGIVWSLLLGYFLWGDIPQKMSIIGIILIASTGLYIAYLESKKTVPR